jgi:YebC/PmpR family DNA-binding regulatory protein
MAGHSHSSNIKFRKDRVDAKRAVAFAKLSRMLTVAARQGGGNPDGNPRLRLALDKARVLSMSREAIERAIKKGTGEGDVGDYEEIVYEGYGPGGVAMMLDILTDNRHRTAADVRMLFDKYGGNLAANGAVGWIFARRGRFTLTAAALAAASQSAASTTVAADEEAALALALEVGAEDLQVDGELVHLLCNPVDFAAVQKALEAKGLPLHAAEFAHLASQRIQVAERAVAMRLLKLVDALEDHDDVQAVWSNEEFTAAVDAALAAGSGDA